MHKFEEFIEHIKKAIPINSASITLFVICIIALVIGGIRACSQVSTSYSQHLYVIARDPSGYPLSLGGKEANVAAFTNDLLLALAKHRNIKIEIISVSDDNLLEGLDAADYGAVISSLEPTPLNARYYNFSEVFFHTGPVLIVNKDSDITSLKDLKDHIIGVKLGEEISLDLTGYDAYYKFYNTISPAFSDLNVRRIDGIVMPVMQAMTYITTFYPDRFKIVTSPLSNEGLRLIARKSHMTDYLIEQFNDGLQDLVNDGTYSILLKKWDLADPFPKPNIPPEEK